MLNVFDSLRPEVIEGIFKGEITPDNLPEGVYEQIGKLLNDGVEKGFGKGLGDVEFGTPDYELLSELRENVYLFSGAKTFQQTLEMSDALVDEDGKLRSLSEFKKAAEQIYVKYNGGSFEDEVKQGWLDTEYNTSVTQAGNAEKWNQIEKKKDLLPMLRYVSVGDETVCDICDPLDGITLPVDDKFWNEHAPSNHFNCRCVLEQTDDAEESSDDEVSSAKEESQIQDEFKYNPGKFGEIFSTEGKSQHPYYAVPREYQSEAKDNWGFRSPAYSNERVISDKDAIEKVEHMPNGKDLFGRDVKDSVKAVFPFKETPWDIKTEQYQNARKEKVKDEVTIPMNRLNATEGHQERSKLIDMLKNSSEIVKQEGELPMVVKYKNEYYIKDGHHRLSTLEIKNYTHARVKLINIDKFQ